jgi:hypothetical protein
MFCDMGKLTLSVFMALAHPSMSCLKPWINPIAVLVLVTAAHFSYAAAAIADSAPAQVSQRTQYQTQGVIFEAPPGFSDLKPLGGKTVGIVLPSGQARPVSVRLAELKPDNLGMTSLEPREFAEYARYSFFGITATPNQHKTRRFLGQDVTGDVLMQSNNGSTTYLEFYMVPLTLNRQLAIAFETDAELPIYLLEKTIQTVTKSMREIPPKQKR